MPTTLAATIHHRAPPDKRRSIGRVTRTASSANTHTVTNTMSKKVSDDSSAAPSTDSVSGPMLVMVEPTATSLWAKVNRILVTETARAMSHGMINGRAATSLSTLVHRSRDG